MRGDSAPVERISDDMVERFFSWAELLIALWKPRTLDFCFHGGEPTLVPDVVDNVGRRINSMAETHGMKKVFSIVTNATLLDEGLVSMLQSHSVNRALCTLDGPPSVHNQRRPFATRQGTFDLTYGNMRRALDKGMSIVLGVNVDRSNYAAIVPFLDLLAEQGFHDYRGFTMLFGMVKEGPKAHNPDYFKRNQYGVDEEASVLGTLYREALNRRIRIVDPIGSGFCTFRTASSYVVDLNGDIYKCVTLAGNPAARVGNIGDPLGSILRGLSQLLYLIPWEKSEGCRACKFLPLCMGGCAQQALLNRGSLGERDCLRPFLSAYIPVAAQLAHDRARMFPEIADANLSNYKEMYRL